MERHMLQQTSSVVMAPSKRQVGSDRPTILEPLVTDKYCVKFEQWQQKMLDTLKCPYVVK